MGVRARVAMCRGVEEAGSNRSQLNDSLRAGTMEVPR